MLLHDSDPSRCPHVNPAPTTGQHDNTTRWGINQNHRARVHIVILGWTTVLCGLPTARPCQRRSAHFRIALIEP